MPAPLTADTITDEQIWQLQADLRQQLGRLVGPTFWTTRIRHEIIETEWALSVGDPLRARLARERCAVLLDKLLATRSGK